jgi:hypothetical protein
MGFLHSKSKTHANGQSKIPFQWMKNIDDGWLHIAAKINFGTPKELRPVPTALNSKFALKFGLHFSVN